MLNFNDKMSVINYYTEEGKCFPITDAIIPEDAIGDTEWTTEDLMVIEECQGVDFGQKVIALRRVTIRTESGNTVVLYQDFKGEVLQCKCHSTGVEVSFTAGQLTRDIYTEAFDRAYRYIEFTFNRNGQRLQPMECVILRGTSFIEVMKDVETMISTWTSPDEFPQTFSDVVGNLEIRFDPYGHINLIILDEGFKFLNS